MGNVRKKQLRHANFTANTRKKKSAMCQHIYHSCILGKLLWGSLAGSSPAGAGHKTAQPVCSVSPRCHLSRKRRLDVSRSSDDRQTYPSESPGDSLSHFLLQNPLFWSADRSFCWMCDVRWCGMDRTRPLRGEGGPSLAVPRVGCC